MEKLVSEYSVQGQVCQWWKVWQWQVLNVCTSAVEKKRKIWDKCNSSAVFFSIVKYIYIKIYIHILQNLTRLQLLQDRRGLEGNAMTPSIVCFNVLLKSQWRSIFNMNILIWTLKMKNIFKISNLKSNVSDAKGKISAVVTRMSKASHYHIYYFELLQAETGTQNVFLFKTE